MPYVCNKHKHNGVQYIAYDCFVRGRGCYYCGREIIEDLHRHTIDFIREEFKSFDLELLSDEYINNSTPLDFICNKHREMDIQKSTYAKLKRSGCCKFCSWEHSQDDKRYTYDFVFEKFAENDLLLLADEYKDANISLPYICNKHPEMGVMYKSFSNLLLGRTGCVACRTEACIESSTMSNEEFIEKVYDIHGDNIIAINDYIKSKEKINFLCNICGHIFSKSPSHVINAEQGCPICAHENRIEKQRISDNEYQNRLFAIHGDNIKILGKYIGGKNPIDLECNICEHQWSPEASSVINLGCGCPVCKMSHGERAIRNYLFNGSIKFIPQQKYDNLIGIGGCKLSYDFYLPNENLLIEYQGEFHDGNNTVQTIEGLERQQEHDRRKRDYAKSRSVNLLEIWYWDFKNIDKILTDYLSNLPKPLAS